MAMEKTKNMFRHDTWRRYEVETLEDSVEDDA